MILYQISQLVPKRIILAPKLNFQIYSILNENVIIWYENVQIFFLFGFWSTFHFPKIQSPCQGERWALCYSNYMKTDDVQNLLL